MDDNRIDWEGWRKSIREKNEREKKMADMTFKQYPGLKVLATIDWSKKQLPKEKEDNV